MIVQQPMAQEPLAGASTPPQPTTMARERCDRRFVSQPRIAVCYWIVLRLLVFVTRSHESSPDPVPGVVG
jgi:hypothetical protein